MDGVAYGGAAQCVLYSNGLFPATMQVRFSEIAPLVCPVQKWFAMGHTRGMGGNGILSNMKISLLYAKPAPPLLALCR